MLPGGLCNTAPRGTIPTPDSSYDWKSFGEHVRAYILLFGAGAGQKVDPARGPERGEPVRRQRLDRREVRDEGRVARESLFLKDAGDFQNRSEEHTSELQSLMRISYAVFCLKKKKKKQMTTMLYQQIAYIMVQT